MDQVADYATDCFDAHEHLNPSGARKVSDYLGRYTTEHYDVDDHRVDAAYTAWADDAAAYAKRNGRTLSVQSDLACALSCCTTTILPAQ